MDIGSILKEIKVSPTRFIQRAHTREILNIKRQSKTFFFEQHGKVKQKLKRVSTWEAWRNFG